MTTTETTPCAVCASHNTPFRLRRGIDWPTQTIAGRVVHRACASEAESALRIGVDAYRDPAGAWRWKSNGQCPPRDYLRIAVAMGVLHPADAEITATTRDREVEEFLAEYRRRQPALPSAEERYEMLAAFGPGAVVVDVFSGRRVQL